MRSNSTWSPEIRQQLLSGRETEKWMSQVRVSGREVVTFTRHLAALIEAGVTLAKALETLSRQVEDPAFGEVLWTVHDSISAGSTLSASLQQFPRIFRPVYVRMIKVGENSGKLPKCLEKLADWSERDLRVLHKVRSALVYPGFVLLLGIVLSLSIFLFLLPPFLAVLQTFGADLPWNTRMLMLMSQLLTRPGFWLMALSGGGLLALQLQSMRERGSAGLWRILLRMPGLGHLLAISSMTRYATAACALLETGCDVATTWRLAAESSGNPLLYEDTQRLLQSIEGGSTVASAMLENPSLYGATLIQFTKSGEEGANLSRMFNSLKRIFEEEVDISLQQFTVLVEPLLLTLVAGVTGFSMISIFMPLYGYLSKL